MADTNQEVVAALCFQACKLLAQHPEGLSRMQVYEGVATVFSIPDVLMLPSETNPGGPLRFHNLIAFQLTAEVKAGWLVRVGKWRLTPSGHDALTRYPSPEAFHGEAKRRYNEWKKLSDQISKAAETNPALREWPLQHPEKLLKVKSSGNLTAAQRTLFDLTSERPGKSVTPKEIGEALGGQSPVQVFGGLSTLSKVLDELAGTPVTLCLILHHRFSARVHQGCSAKMHHEFTAKVHHSNG
jgi:hypothetical protein